jgi:cell division protein FtsW
MRQSALTLPLNLLRESVAALTERQVLLLSAGFLFCIGLIMVGSASMGVADATFGNPFYFFIRHFIYLGIGLLTAALVLQVPMQTWNQYCYKLFLVALVLIIIVLIPGIGRRVNGSMRWIGLGGITLQPSEVMKFAGVMALAGYLVRRQEEVRSKLSGFVKPMAFVAIVLFLLLMEPDFGASLVIITAVMVMLFLAGAPMVQFIAISGAVFIAGVAVMIAEPYRMKRLLAFTDPWADQYNTGYQLVQSLIAFGRGDWFGVGLGHSVQKLFYLPEAHTDFVFAVYAEEFGLVGVLLLLVAVVSLVIAAMRIGQRAERAGQYFSAYVAYGLAVIIGIQSAINIGVNIGFFPTKGLTLPLVSYGGSSLVVVFAILAVLLRIDAESGNVQERGVRRAAGGKHVAG